MHDIHFPLLSAGLAWDYGIESGLSLVCHTVCQVAEPEGAEKGWGCTGMDWARRGKKGRPAGGHLLAASLSGRAVRVGSQGPAESPGLPTPRGPTPPGAPRQRQRHLPMSFPPQRLLAPMTQN